MVQGFWTEDSIPILEPAKPDQTCYEIRDPAWALLPSCPDNLGEGGWVGEKEKCLLLRRSLGKAGTQTRDQEVGLKMDAKLPPGPSSQHHPSPRSQKKTALLIAGAQKLPIGKSCDQRAQYPVYSETRERAASMAHNPPHPTQAVWIKIFGKAQEFCPLLPSTTPLCETGFKHSSTHGDENKLGHSFIHSLSFKVFRGFKLDGGTSEMNGVGT